MLCCLICFSDHHRHCSSVLLAGCDDLDSDGDNLKDDCEDRWAPELVVRNAEIFRCDESNTDRLYYCGSVFSTELQVNNFLQYQFPATDDCAATNRLQVQIEYERGSCRDTVYKLTPLQDIPGCEGRNVIYTRNGTDTEIAFVNPLNGTSKEVTVELDIEDPSITCGFTADGINEVSADGKTLYHYMLESEEMNGQSLVDAQLTYEVEDNCDSDATVSMVVKSNEIQKGDVAELFKAEVDGVQQAMFLYAATSCEVQGRSFHQFYPDWEGGEGQYCKHDGNQPQYMTTSSESWMHDSEEECCAAYFQWAYSECVEISSGGTKTVSNTRARSLQDAPEVRYGPFYPAWNSPDHVCKADGKQPIYMNNSKGWVFKTLKECCEHHYSWNYDECMEAPISPFVASSDTAGTSTTGGGSALSSTASTSSKLCKNPNTGQHIRFYDLSITATDFAGNKKMDMCKVVM